MADAPTEGANALEWLIGPTTLLASNAGVLPSCREAGCGNSVWNRDFVPRSMYCYAHALAHGEVTSG